MILLINNTADLKEVLGFIDADFNFDNIKPDIISATNDVIKLIGKEMYDTIVASTDVDMLNAAKFPIGVQAYRHYAPNNDLNHTNSGRMNRTEEHEKPAFEWQVDRDNKALERKYYKYLDDLINILDEKGGTDWKDTNNYKATFNLFIRNTDDFDKYFNINGSRFLFIKLSPGIRMAEDNELIPRIGKSLFDNMKKKLKGETVADFTINEPLLAKIQEFLVYKSVAWGFRRLSVQIFPEGVMQAYTPDKVTTQSRMVPVKSESAAAAQYFDQDAGRVLLAIEIIIASMNAVEPVIPPKPIKFEYSEEQNFINT